MDGAAGFMSDSIYFQLLPKEFYMQFIKIAAGVFIAISLMACGSSSSPTAQAYCERGIQCVEDAGDEANSLSQCLSNYDDVFSNLSSSELETAETALSNCTTQETCGEFFNCVEAFAASN